ncbi:hypothetical protein VPNG_00486 [Cytospora leucostoma]|uniref:MICOS complex subunit MIC60 n=1 Tax=Cytospora leucostoma TaxID=1230097 RepID=A0A423XN39_9PEZI|nr:hypothetical protein VPNG_00486 [Cytospora leucostoma]
MLRISLRSVRGLGSRPIAAASGHQWQAAVAARPAGLVARRCYADEKAPISQVPKPPVSETNTGSSSETPTTTPREADIEASTIRAENVPLTPPAPEDLAKVTKTEKSAPIPPPTSGRSRRLRNYVLTLVILGSIAFGSGVWYSRINDQFHDFFTEYIPYGEAAVLYLDELEFRKRFPNISNRGPSSRHRDTGEAVRIPAQSGISWRVADSGEDVSRQSSAVEGAQRVKEVLQSKEPEPKRKVQPVQAKVIEEPKQAAPAPAAATSDYKGPEVNEPSRYPPAAPIEPIYFPEVNERVVHDLAHMLNDLIAVINADKAHGKYGSSIEKAKNELRKVNEEIDHIKSTVEQDAAGRVKARMEDFDKAANDLVTRVESAMAAQEAGWQREFGAEINKIKQTFDERVNIMTERERRLNEERLNNQLLEQAIEIKKALAKEIKKRVDVERDGRLGKLEELSKSVSDLEKLTSGWNDVIDLNLRTQQLHVAVEAVRASLENASHPRPFIKELVALKEIAADDSVVNAAIASINPTAYQRGISTSQDLIDRFRRVATEVRKASLLPEDAGVASHASSYVLSKVMFKKQGLAAGDDVESILTRTHTFLEEGDLDAAAREMNGLNGWAKTLSRDWLGEVRKVLEVKQALEVIRTEARLQSLKVE